MPEHIALDRVESRLKDLIGILRDGQEGFKELGHRLQHDRAKQLFLKEMQVHAEYAAELENELHRLGVHDVKATASRSSKARLLWGEIQASLAGGEKALLSTAAKQEELAAKAYADAMKEELSLPLRELLDRQQEHIERTHNQIKALHDLVKA
jgi:uncharacterized protein (TIGR02284 family)